MSPTCPGSTRELIDELLHSVPAGGGAIVVRGGPGIGRSALLQRARARARTLGIHTLVTAGAESEAELAFAGLHQLLHPIIGLTRYLADPLRRGARHAPAHA